MMHHQQGSNKKCKIKFKDKKIQLFFSFIRNIYNLIHRSRVELIKSEKHQLIQSNLLNNLTISHTHRERERERERESSNQGPRLPMCFYYQKGQ